MKPRLHQLWRGQHGRCFYCDGDTLFDGRTFSGESAPGSRTWRTRKFKPFIRATVATLATLARECDGGNRARENLVVACRFCFEARRHPFALDHRAEMRAMIKYGAHPLHRNSDVAAVG